VSVLTCNCPLICCPLINGPGDIFQMTQWVNVRIDCLGHGRREQEESSPDRDLTYWVISKMSPGPLINGQQTNSQLQVRTLT
jgi:hypothetical protein